MSNRSLSLNQEFWNEEATGARSENNLGERLLVGRLRSELLSHASGKTLDLACGDGINFRRYPQGCRITAGDIDEMALAAARATARRLGREIHIQRINAQAIPFPDDSFDTVVSSLALCSYPDPLVALTEMSRVCKPDGRILLLEHGRSSVGIWAKWQDYKEEKRGPHTGCHDNREPFELANQAGLRSVSSRRTWFGTVHLINAQPAP